MLSYSEANSPYQLTNSLTLQLVNWSTASDKKSISLPSPLGEGQGVRPVVGRREASCEAFTPHS